MNRILQLEVPDTTYTALAKQAAAEGVKPETVAARAIEEQYPAGHSQPEHLSDPVVAFREMFGAASLGHATGLENEQLDAELAKEYGQGLGRP